MESKLSQRDVDALIELLRRTPMTKAEELWASAFVQYLLLLIQSTTGEDNENV